MSNLVAEKKVKSLDMIILKLPFGYQRHSHAQKF